MSTAMHLDDLAADPVWVAWRNELRGGKPTKVPYAPDGRKAKSDDASTRGTRREAETEAARIVNGLGGGIGIELGDLNAGIFIVGIDLDSCLRTDGTLADWARPFLAVVPSYTEISPSGGGLKTFFYMAAEGVRPFLELTGVKPENWGFSRSIPGERPKTDHGPGIELYTARRYFTVTGNLWPDQPKELVALDWPALQRLAQIIPLPDQERSSGGTGRDNSRSSIAFRKGATLKATGKSFEEFCEALQRDPETADWYAEKGAPNGERELHRIWDKAEAALAEGVRLDDFHAYMPMHSYIFAPSGEMWPAASVDARIPPVPLVDVSDQPITNKKGDPLRIEAHRWLDRNRPVEQMSWMPGMPILIEDRLTSHAGWIERRGARVFNLYRGPAIARGDANLATPWLRHLRRVFPAEHRHLARFLAHRLQHPGDKVNHAIVLGGAQGIGKDTLLEPVKQGVGPWNWHDISPKDLAAPFNGFAKSVVLRINEGHDLGNINRYQFYEHTKSYIAAPPDVLRVNEKHLREYYVPNVCGVIITTNHKTHGIYLPPDDRRHYVAWSNLTKEEFEPEYWNRLWGWYEAGGLGHVATYLSELNISDFDPKAPPPKTDAWWALVDAGRPSEDADLASVLEKLKNPDAFILDDLAAAAPAAFAEWLHDRKNRRVIPHRLEGAGYGPVRNPDAKSGLWAIGGEKQVIYALASLTTRDQLRAVAQRRRGVD